MLTPYVRSWIKFIQPFLPFFFLFALLCVCATISESSHLSKDWVWVLWEIRVWSFCPVAASPSAAGLWESILRLNHAWCFPLSWKLAGTKCSKLFLPPFPFFFFPLPISVFHFHASKGWVHYCVINQPVNFYAFCCIWAAPVPQWQLLGSAHCNYQLKTKMLLGAESILAETELVLNLIMGRSSKRSHLVVVWLCCHCWYWGSDCSLSQWTLWEAVISLKEYRSLFFISCWHVV